jgi:hypothetical protein
MEAMHPNKIFCLINFYNLVSEESVDLNVVQPYGTFKFSVKIVLIERGIYASNMMQNGPNGLLAKELVKIMVYLPIDEDWVAVEFQQGRGDLFQIVLTKPSGLNASHPRDPELRLERQYVLCVPLRTPTAQIVLMKRDREEK